MRGAAAAEEAATPLPPLRRVGGPLLMRPSDRLHLRIVVDHSCVEVYAGSGEVLSTRVYRGRPPEGGDAGIDFVAFGGPAMLERVAAYELASALVPSAQREAGETPTVAAQGLADVFRREPSMVAAAATAPGTPLAAGTPAASAVGMPTVGERADALFADLLMGLPGLELKGGSPMGVTAQ